MYSVSLLATHPVNVHSTHTHKTHVQCIFTGYTPPYQLVHATDWTYLCTDWTYMCTEGEETVYIQYNITKYVHGNYQTRHFRARITAIRAHKTGIRDQTEKKVFNPCTTWSRPVYSCTASLLYTIRARFHENRAPLESQSVNPCTDEYTSNAYVYGYNNKC